MKKYFLLLAVCFVIFDTADGQHQLIKKWETDSLFKVPESVLYDQDHRVLYVANIEGQQPWEKDGKGSIGKLGVDGKIISVQWITGLNAPKGMAIYHHQLYVADVDRLVRIDLHNQRIADSIVVAGAQGLNDVTIDAQGIIYVSDSRGKKIYRIENNTPAIYLDSLKGPNGVLMRGSELFLLDNGSMFKVNADKTLQLIASGMEGGTDGIENVSGNDFIVSCWAGVIWYVDEKGQKQLLLDTRAEKKNTADIGYDANTRTLFVPTFWKNSVVAYEVK